MNYIFDITLNFNKELYNFYEWNDDDNIKFFLKVPIFKVEDDVLNDMINSTIIVDKLFLKKINNKSECYSKTGTNIVSYLALFSTDSRVIGIMFNKNGESIKKSFLSIDEEEDVLEFSKMIKYSIIEYKIKQRNNKNKFITRTEENTKENLFNKISSIQEKKEIDKLKYIFYEMYGEREENEKRMYSKLFNLIENNFDKMNKLKIILDNMECNRKKV